MRYSASTTPDDEPLYALQAGGQVFDAETLEWRPVSGDGAPSPRYLPNVAVVGNRFVVYGGFGAAGRSGVVVDSELRDGAIYDPDADAWTPISSFGASLLTDEELPPMSGSPLAVLSNDTTVFLIDRETGSGAVYDLRRDTWTAVADAPFAPTNRWQYGSDGSLLNVTASRSLVLEPGAGSWVEVDHGPGYALPAGSSWVVEVWTGRSLLRWGASTVETIGCENPPPNVGCDPLISYTWVAQGAMTRLL